MSDSREPWHFYSAPLTQPAATSLVNARMLDALKEVLVIDAVPGAVRKAILENVAQVIGYASLAVHDDNERDYPEEFEKWWMRYKHRNRTPADYSPKKQIAFDAFYFASRTRP